MTTHRSVRVSSLTGGVVLALAGCLLCCASANAGEPSHGDFPLAAGWPFLDKLTRVLSLRDYNTRIVVLGVAILGGASGLIGSFTLLRKRALMGDALSHASLPGIAIAFIAATALGRDGKSLPLLLAGATLSGMLGVGVILWIRNRTRLKEDAALGIVLSVFFGMGVALLGIIQKMPSGSAAGLDGFIFGKTASMTRSDVELIAIASALVLIGCLLLFKELKLLCFDESFAGSRGYPIVALDVGLMGMVVLLTIVGLQAVGLVLMIALMVIPAAAARFWTEEVSAMAGYSIVMGSLGSVFGAVLSAVLPDLPSGAMIVLVCASLFFLSMVFGRSRGLLVRSRRRRRLNRRVERQHLLRGMYELIEADGRTTQADPKTRIPTDQLLPLRSWSRNRLSRAIEEAEEDELVRRRSDDVQLTRQGFTEAARLTRQHRMWEMYLIAYADVAPASVDRDADHIEHVLAPEVIDQLEELLEAEQMTVPVPASPHAMPHGSGS